MNKEEFKKREQQQSKGGKQKERSSDRKGCVSAYLAITKQVLYNLSHFKPFSSIIFHFRLQNSHCARETAKQQKLLWEVIPFFNASSMNNDRYRNNDNTVVIVHLILARRLQYTRIHTNKRLAIPLLRSLPASNRPSLIPLWIAHHPTFCWESTGTTVEDDDETHLHLQKSTNNDNNAHQTKSNNNTFTMLMRCSFLKQKQQKHKKENNECTWEESYNDCCKGLGPEGCPMGRKAPALLWKKIRYSFQLS